LAEEAIFMGKIPRKEEFGGLFDPIAELFRDVSLEWPPARFGYIIWQGKIHARPGPPQGGFPSPNPFAHTDLFYSFARLGASGKPSESRIMEWVSQNGLLTRIDESVSGATVLEDGAVNQQPISVEDFRSEVSRACAMLELYAEIRALDVRALNFRIAQPRSAVDRQLASYFSENPSYQQVMDRIDIWIGSLAIRSVLGAADKVLAELISESIAGVRPRAIRGYALPMAPDAELASHRLAAAKNYRMQQGWYYPDLRSAMYMQLYLLVTQNQPMRICDNPPCRMPFPATRKNRRFCCDNCRSNARHYR
jgi:hypothetical protein